MFQFLETVSQDRIYLKAATKTIKANIQNGTCDDGTIIQENRVHPGYQISSTKQPNYP